MVYYDIHTHHLPVHPEDVAIVNSLVPTFDVETGLFRSVGIHPWYIYNVEEQLAELKRQVSFPDVVDIGETGDVAWAEDEDGALLRKESFVRK